MVASAAAHWMAVRPGGGKGSFEQSAPRPAPTAKPCEVGEDVGVFAARAGEREQRDAW